MREPLFIDGFPARITTADFRYEMLPSFPRFSDGKNDNLIDSAIDAIYDQFTGVNELWESCGKNVWYSKSTRCYISLVAWYIVEHYPRFAAGIHTSGGALVTEKKIGDVTIKYSDTGRYGSTESVLEMLKSNVFGKDAYMMIKGAPMRWYLRTLNTY